MHVFKPFNFPQAIELKITNFFTILHTRQKNIKTCPFWVGKKMHIDGNPIVLSTFICQT